MSDHEPYCECRDCVEPDPECGCCANEPTCDATGDTRTVCECNCGEPRFEHGTCDYHAGAPYVPCEATAEAEARATWCALTRPNVARWP